MINATALNHGSLPPRTRWNRAICAFLLCGVTICGFAYGALAQAGTPEPIRVESNEVLIPALVLDKKRVAQFQEMNPSVFATQAMSKDFHAWKELAVRNLTAGDFEVFEDGQKQKIGSISPGERASAPVLRDNLGQYVEFVGIGRGIWTVPENYLGLVQEESRTVNATGTSFLRELPDLSGYLIAYVPPRSPDGSCHEVTVKVSRPNSLVYARNEYCNARHTAADPLKGTKVGKKMESDLSSRKRDKTSLSLMTFASLLGSGSIRVRIFLELPLKPLVLQGEDCHAVAGTIDILGVVYSDDGALTARFSDLADRNDDNFSLEALLLSSIPVFDAPQDACGFYEPNRYETQVDLAPGEYDLRVVLSDGKNFGRAETPITVESYAAKQLAISEIALARRFRPVPVGSQDAATTLPGTYVPLVSKGVEITPTANTRFKKGDPFNFYFEVYHPQQPGSPASAVEAHLRIVDAKTGQVMKDLEPVNATPYTRPGDPVIPIGGGIDIGDLPPGSYRLEAQANDSDGGSTPWRTASFTINQ